VAEQIFPMVIAGHLEDAEIPFEAEATANSCPSAKTSNSFVVDGSMDSTLWLEDQFWDASAVFVACDKGKRKGIDHFPKVISWWSKTEKKVCSACIDADGSGGTSEERAKATWHSIQKFRGAMPFFVARRRTVAVAVRCTAFNGKWRCCFSVHECVLLHHARCMV
jgi:hypothetical protein